MEKMMDISTNDQESFSMERQKLSYGELENISDGVNIFSNNDIDSKSKTKDFSKSLAVAG